MASKHVFVTTQSGLSAELSPMGAALKSLKFDGVEMLYVDPRIDFDKPNNGYYGQIVSPLAGRIKKGILGPFAFPVNERGNALHSSVYTSAWKEFEVNVFELDGDTDVIFTRKEKLFGANVELNVHYAFSGKAARFTQTITLHADGPIPANPSSHIYFSLGQDDVSTITVSMQASQAMAYDEEAVPLGFVPMQEPFRLEKPWALGRNLDNSFRLDRAGVSFHGERFDMETLVHTNALHLYVDLPSQANAATPKGFALEPVQFPSNKENEAILEANKYLTVLTQYSFSKHL